MVAPIAGITMTARLGVLPSAICTTGAVTSQTQTTRANT